MLGDGAARITEYLRRVGRTDLPVDVVIADPLREDPRDEKEGASSGSLSTAALYGHSWANQGAKTSVTKNCSGPLACERPPIWTCRIAGFCVTDKLYVVVALRG